MSVTAKTLIKRALRKINAYDREQEPTAQEFTDCLEELNALIKSWFSSDIIIMHTTQESFTLSNGTATYSIGSGGDFNTTRPYRIEAAFIRVGSQDYPLKVITDLNYRGIPLKSTSDRPIWISYHPTFPLGYVNFYYTPDSAYTVYMDNYSPLAEITSLTATFTLAPEYENPIVYNLAVLLAPEFEKAVPISVAAKAVEFLDQLKALNLSRRVRPVELQAGQLTLDRIYEDLSSC